MQFSQVNSALDMVNLLNGNTSNFTCYNFTYLFVIHYYVYLLIYFLLLKTYNIHYTCSFCLSNLQVCEIEMYKIECIMICSPLLCKEILVSVTCVHIYPPLC